MISRAFGGKGMIPNAPTMFVYYLTTMCVQAGVGSEIIVPCWLAERIVRSIVDNSKNVGIKDGQLVRSWDY